MKNTNIVVVDTSVVLKWFIEEEIETTKKARKILRLFKEGEITLWAPDILLYEFANVLSHKKTLPKDLSKKTFELIESSGINIYTPSYKFILKAYEFAQTHSTTVYDSSYAVLAEEKGGILITADNIFASAVNLDYVIQLDSHKIKKIDS